ncbi:PREDICTED: disintegrin and metalloproteinase domain-containing protein 20-like [Dipodomys ordii]|uniref:Disintegrin and metalloproteinase domain-containing protein 20-like n=1 Tax=Dipodomys ordii TaxID=10020 RepID=A0A1S3F034_DIPOR|nr:PREDICTED: disintegrin and metalloproteinase domain-containing protein 20-like [Dipodomys ordii]
MRAAWAQGLLPGALWLPVLWTLLSPACCSYGPPGWRFTSSEIVIPRKVPHRKGGIKMPDQLAYSMRFRGQRHVFHMKLKKNLLPRHLPVITDSNQEGMQEDYPFLPGDCYYYSYLEGVPGSLATLDTCHGGLRGRIQVDDFTYEIKPLETSSTFEHVISLLVVEERGEASQRCDIGEEETKPVFEDLELLGSPRAGTYYLWRKHPKDTRVMYIVSYSYINHFKNQTLVLEHVMIINSIIDTIYKPTGFNIRVRFVLLWDTTDAVSLEINNAFAFLRNFGRWMHSTWQHRVSHSISVLIAGQLIAEKNHYAVQGAICNDRWAVLFVAARRFHVFLASTMIAHTLGHQFNMAHDSPHCLCFRRTHCLMTPVPNLQDTISNCSYPATHQWVLKWDTCMWQLNVPYESFRYVAPRCGDKIINQLEDCDCGSFKECASDKCCGTDCMFTPGSKCNEGDCCQDCKFSPPGTICRDIGGICDLTEYCDGQSEKCPNDTYIQDGTPCSPRAVCMRGNCSDRETQCQALFGRNIKDGAAECYKQLNMIGDRFGNCGMKSQRGGPRIVKCSKENFMCGMLHCSGLSNIPGGGEHTAFRHLSVRYEQVEHHCFGYDAHFGTELPQMGMVVDGAMCAPGRFCFEKNCTSHVDLNFDCDVRRCNYKGVCNNNHNCHCMPGWKPPTCEEKGQGGSEDSGPPGGRQQRLRTYIHVDMHRIIPLMLARLILYLLSILAGAIPAIKSAVTNRLFKVVPEAKPPKKPPK